MNSKEAIKQSKLKPFSHFCSIFKSAKKGQKSFRVTQQLLQSAYYKASKIGKIAKLIITIPANQQENYVLECILKKVKK